MTDKTIQLATHEVVGLFDTRQRFDAAVAALLKAHFERSELSVLSSHESIDAAGSPGKPWREALIALTGELKYEVPMVASGAVLLAGGPMAATIAGLVGAAVSGVALKEALDEVTSTPNTEDFARSVAAGSVILWVRVDDAERETTAKAILLEAGATNVHVHETRHDTTEN